MSLDDMRERKGELSGAIGQAKKRGEPIASLIAEMKVISQQIKSLENQTKTETVLAANIQGDSSGSESIKTSEILLAANSKPQYFSYSNANSVSNDSNVSSLSESALDKIVVRQVDESEILAWDAYVLSRKEASVYHYWAFRRVIEQSFGHNALYLAAYDSDDNLSGVLPLIEVESRLFGHYFSSMPFFNYGGVLANNSEIASALLDHAITLISSDGIDYVELRMAAPLNELAATTKDVWLAKTQKITMIRELPNEPEQLWKDLGTKLRAQIKKSQRFDLKIKFGHVELLDDFYRVFARNMRDLGTPVYAKSFFRHILELGGNHDVCVGVVYLKNKPVSCCFLIGHNEILEIPWASTLREANHMNANMFMYWEVLQRAVAKSYSFFDFGRSSKQANTYKFKKQWGAQPYQLYWSYWLNGSETLPDISPSNSKYELLIKIWQRMPVCLANIIGPYVVKYLP